MRVASGRSQDHGRAAEALCPLRSDHSSDEDGVDCVQQAGDSPGVDGGKRHIRLPRVDPLLDAITPGILGDQTQDSPKAAAAHQEVTMAMVSPESSYPAAIPVPAVMPEVARAFPVLRYPGELPPAGGGPQRSGKGVAILAQPSQ